MAAKRDYTEEILSIKSRNKNSDSTQIPDRIRSLKDILSKLGKDDSEQLKYIPIALIACIEGHTRTLIKMLIDSSPLYLDRITKFDQITIKLSHLSDILKKTISIGDFISHLLSVNSLDDIISHFTKITETEFIKEISQVYDRWKVEIEGNPKEPIIKNIDENLKYVTKTFELRHIFAHEISDNIYPSFEEIKNCLIQTEMFLEAINAFVDNILFPNAPLTQSAMNEEAYKSLEKSEEGMKVAVDKLKSLLGDEEKNELDKDQELWEAFVKHYAEFEADTYVKGGSMWPTIMGHTATGLNSYRAGMLNGLHNLLNSLFGDITD